MLEKKFEFKAHYTMIEKDEVIVELASKYALPRLESPTTIVCTSANAYVNQTSETFDLIVLDVFVDDVVPQELEGTTFLKGISSILTEEGLFIYNRLYRTQSDARKTDQFYHQEFKRIFKDSQDMEVEGNKLLIYQNKKTTE